MPVILGPRMQGFHLSPSLKGVYSPLCPRGKCRKCPGRIAKDHTKCPPGKVLRMLRVLTDEESVAAADEQIAIVTAALRSTLTRFPETNLEALKQVLWMVNGQNWISPSDLARACVAAR